MDMESNPLDRGVANFLARPWAYKYKYLITRLPVF